MKGILDTKWMAWVMVVISGGGARGRGEGDHAVDVKAWDTG